DGVKTGARAGAILVLAAGGEPAALARIAAFALVAAWRSAARAFGAVTLFASLTCSGLARITQLTAVGALAAGAVRRRAAGAAGAALGATQRSLERVSAAFELTCRALPLPSGRGAL